MVVVAEEECNGGEVVFPLDESEDRVAVVLTLCAICGGGGGVLRSNVITPSTVKD